MQEAVVSGRWLESNTAHKKRLIAHRARFRFLAIWAQEKHDQMMDRISTKEAEDPLRGGK
jgi:hypothetical protein